MAANWHGKHKNGYNLVSFTDIELRYGVVVVESHPYWTVRSITDHARSLLKALPWKCWVRCIIWNTIIFLKIFRFCSVADLWHLFCLALVHLSYKKKHFIKLQESLQNIKKLQLYTFCIVPRMYRYSVIQYCTKNKQTKNKKKQKPNLLVCAHKLGQEKANLILLKST